MRTDPASGHGVVVAETADGQIVGFAGGGPERGGNALYKGELCAIHVLADDQRAGLGRRLTGGGGGATKGRGPFVAVGFRGSAARAGRGQGRGASPAGGASPE